MVPTLKIARLFGVVALAGFGLAGCDEAALGTLGGTGSGGSSAATATGGAPGDEVFTRDEKGCLYQTIEGSQIPIVDERGRQQCDRLS